MEFTFSDTKLDGVTFKQHEVSCFTLKELDYSPGVQIPKHTHEQANFCMAIKGGCTEIYGSKAREYTPFSLSYLPAYQSHSLKVSSQGMRAFSINIPLYWLERMRERSLNVEDSIFWSSGILTQLLMRLYQEYQNIDEASPIAVEGIALEMLAEVSRYKTINKGSKPPHWLKQSRDLVHEQFSLHLSLDTIAQEVGVHPVHLARMFRKYYRCTIGDYIRTLRIENACREMITTEAPLIEIALSNGFSDQSHFNRIFRRLKGMTPAEYRAKYRTR
jgi:AraC family transcriptional regulator